MNQTGASAVAEATAGVLAETLVALATTATAKMVMVEARLVMTMAKAIAFVKVLWALDWLGARVSPRIN